MSPGQRGTGRAGGGAGLFGRIIATLATCTLLVVAVMFSVALLAVAMTAGAILLGWLWWKTRRVRRQMQDPDFAGFHTSTQDGSHQQDGHVIDGEVIKGEWKEDQNP